MASIEQLQKQSDSLVVELVGAVAEGNLPKAQSIARFLVVADSELARALLSQPEPEVLGYVQVSRTSKLVDGVSTGSYGTEVYAAELPEDIGLYGDEYVRCALVTAKDEG